VPTVIGDPECQRDERRGERRRSALRPSWAATAAVAALALPMRSSSVVIVALLAVALGPIATTAKAPGQTAAECRRPAGVQRIVFSGARYPNVRRHLRRAVLQRGSATSARRQSRRADERRERLLRDIPTREGFDRDEYPPAVGRGRGPGLERGRTHADGKPTCATSRHQRTAPTAHHTGAQLQPLCNGTRFRYVFR